MDSAGDIPFDAAVPTLLSLSLALDVATNICFVVMMSQSSFAQSFWPRAEWRVAAAVSTADLIALLLGRVAFSFQVMLGARWIKDIAWAVSHWSFSILSLVWLTFKFVLGLYCGPNPLPFARVEFPSLFAADIFSFVITAIQLWLVCKCRTLSESPFPSAGRMYNRPAREPVQWRAATNLEDVRMPLLAHTNLPAVQECPVGEKEEQAGDGGGTGGLRKRNSSLLSLHDSAQDS